jgi:hypothetical protein
MTGPQPAGSKRFCGGGGGGRKTTLSPTHPAAPTALEQRATSWPIMADQSARGSSRGHAAPAKTDLDKGLQIRPKVS